jgi:hypothetical protein
MAPVSITRVDLLTSSPFFDPERWHRLQAKLAERGRAQRGQRRAPDASAYPLAARVFNLTGGCGSIMQGAARRDRGGGRRLYRCGIYMKCRGSCHHNAVDDEALLTFTVRTLTKLVTAVRGRRQARGGRQEAGPDDRNGGAIPATGNP